MRANIVVGAVVFALIAASIPARLFAADEIVVGHVASLTGDTATFGVSAEEGIRLALDEVNTNGVLGGKKIKVVTEDDRSLGDEAKTAVREAHQ